jgi:PhnB protein
MHASFRIGDSTLMASDGLCSGQPSFKGFSLSLTPPGVAEAERLFGLLADGGQVQMPLAKTFYSPMFGMVADRFGVSWMIYVAP